MHKFISNKAPLLTLFAILITSNIMQAQELIWKAGFNSFFDNREYFNEYAPPGSYLGARTFVEGGFAFDEYNSFHAGVDFMYEFGDEVQSKFVKPILYFHHKHKYSEVYMGNFHRKDLMKLPNLMQSDTFQYYRPNIEGIFLNFYNDWASQSVWLDWTSRQTETARETFLIGGTGKVGVNTLFFRYDFLMYHFAGTASKDTTDIKNVRDNGAFTASFGVNLSGFTPLDSLVLKTGFTFSYDRWRGFYETQNYYGSISELYSSYKRFGLRNTLYVGDGQINLVGDQMYTSEFYDRLDLIVNIFKKGPIKGEVEIALHFLPGVLDYSQKFTIYLDINGRKPLKSKNIQF